MVLKFYLKIILIILLYAIEFLIIFGNGISMFLQKLLKYFNGTIISTFFVPSSPVESVIFLFEFKFSSNENYQEHEHYSKLFHLYTIAINFLMFLKKYCSIPLNFTLALLHQCLLHYLSV